MNIIVLQTVQYMVTVHNSRSDRKLCADELLDTHWNLRLDCDLPPWVTCVPTAMDASVVSVSRDEQTESYYDH